MLRFQTAGNACQPLKAYQLLIERCMSEKRYDIAEVFLQRAILHDPRNVNLLLKLAEVEEHLRKNDRAIQTYQKVLVLSSWQVTNPHFQKASKKISLITSTDLLPQLSD